jgi:hypothetical protein
MLSPNRTAVVISAKEPFLEWLHAVDPTSHHLTLADLNQDPTIYLLSEAQDEEEANASLAEVCEEIFEDQLDGWFRVPELWPRDLSLGAFQQRFEYRIDLMIVDLCDAPLLNEEI